MTVLLRFRDLKARGVVKSWPQLNRMQKLHDFPLGRLMSPNVRAWTEEEIEAYIESRPIENSRPRQGITKKSTEERREIVRRAKERKAAAAKAAAGSTAA
jgi:hypothetical protein